MIAQSYSGTPLFLKNPLFKSIILVVVGGCRWLWVVVGGNFALFWLPRASFGGPLGDLGRSLASLGLALGVPGATWGSLWALWVRLGTSMGGGVIHLGAFWSSWAVLGPPGGFIWVPFAPLGRSLGRLGDSSGCLEVILGGP